MATVYCSECGSKNKSKDIHCTKCNSTLKTDKISYGEKITSFNKLITKENYQILSDTYFTSTMYQGVLDEIIRIGKNKFTYDENDTALNNIINLADQYVDIYSKRKGSSAGFYIANQIYFEERSTDAEKIGTIIHELTHHLFAEIFEQFLMYALCVEKTKYIEAYVLFTFIPPNLQLLNEYVAHTTEGQFIIHGCQNYGSFIKIMEENHIKLEEVKELLALGRAVSNDITMILEEFIDENLRKRIIQQYTINNVPRRFDQIEFEEVEEMPEDFKSEFIGVLLRGPMDACLKDKKIMEILRSRLDVFNQ